MTKTPLGFVVLTKENVSSFAFKNFKVNTHTHKKIYQLLYIILKSRGMKQNDGLFVREERSRNERRREPIHSTHFCYHFVPSLSATSELCMQKYKRTETRLRGPVCNFLCTNRVKMQICPLDVDFVLAQSESGLRLEATETWINFTLLCLYVWRRVRSKAYWLRASALHCAFKTRQRWGCNCSLPKINSNMRASAYATHVEQIFEK